MHEKSHHYQERTISNSRAVTLQKPTKSAEERPARNREEIREEWSVGERNLSTEQLTQSY